jgi:hypothetical protein
MTEIITASSELASMQTLTFLAVGGIVILGLSALVSAIERMFERLAQRDR